MQEYEVNITEILESSVTVDAENEDEALNLALEELDKDFCAPYHTSCAIKDYTITPTQIHGDA